MQAKRYYVGMGIVIAALMMGCSKDDQFSTESDTLEGEMTGTNQNGLLPSTDIADPTSSTFEEVAETPDSTDEDRVENSVFSTVVKVHFDGDEVTVSNPSSGVSIQKEGAHVVVNASVAEVAYELSGSATNGSFKIYSSKKFKLTLNGIELTNPQGAAINIQSKKRNFIVLADGSVNTLADGANYASVENEDMKATFFSEGQSIFSGTGSLSITGNYKHALCNDQYLRFRSGGTYRLTAVKDGMHANDEIRFDGSRFEIISEGDGVECEAGNVLVQNADLQVITSGTKGHAIKSSLGVTVNGGVLNLTVKGDASKGISADGDVYLTGGYMKIATSGSAIYESDEADLSSSSAVKCDGNLFFENATLYANSTGAAGKGISVDGDLTVGSGKIVVETTGRQYVYNKLDSSPKGIKAEGALTINDGFVRVTASGGEGSEGIESKSVLTVNGGTIIANCYDDCLNASNAIVINGGNIFCNSSGNDGIDSNGTLTVTGGLVISAGTTSPEEGFDCDQNTFKITGGTLIGLGGGSSTPTASVCTQRSVLYSGSSFVKDDYMTIHTEAGVALATFQLPRSYNQMTLLFSSPLLQSSTTYYISSQVKVSGGNAWNGYYLGGNYSEGVNLTGFTPSSMVTTLGSSNNPGGGWPNGGGRP